LIAGRKTGLTDPDGWSHAVIHDGGGFLNLQFFNASPLQPGVR
jgi:hypothetical protein